jgi:hypothetical protein
MTCRWSARSIQPSFSKDDAVQALSLSKPFRIPGPGEFGNRNPVAGQTPPDGVFYYFLKEKPKDEVKLRILTASGKLVREISSKPPAHPDEPNPTMTRDRTTRFYPPRKV